MLHNSAASTDRGTSFFDEQTTPEVMRRRGSVMRELPMVIINMPGGDIEVVSPAELL